MDVLNDFQECTRGLDQNLCELVPYTNKYTIIYDIFNQMQFCMNSGPSCTIKQICYQHELSTLYGRGTSVQKIKTIKSILYILEYEHGNVWQDGQR